MAPFLLGKKVKDCSTEEMSFGEFGEFVLAVRPVRAVLVRWCQKVDWWKIRRKFVCIKFIRWNVEFKINFFIKFQLKLQWTRGKNVLQVLPMPPVHKRKYCQQQHRPIEPITVMWVKLHSIVSLNFVLITFADRICELFDFLSGDNVLSLLYHIIILLAFKVFCKRQIMSLVATSSSAQR